MSSIGLIPFYKVLQSCSCGVCIQERWDDGPSSWCGGTRDSHFDLRGRRGGEERPEQSDGARDEWCGRTGSREHV